MALRRARKSAPGPDGLGAKAWLATPLGVETLAEAMTWQLEGPPMRQEWNLSIAVFPAKGTRDDDPQEVLRRAGETRPLALENTSKKAVMWALTSCTKKVAGWHCVDTQGGFICGRNFCNNIIELDARSRVLSMAAGHGGSPFLISFDWGQAFPIIAQD
eukprot:581675-Pyramimonas_sp.AAC.1